MTDPADPSRDNGRPDPATAGTPAEFVEALRRLKRWAGLGYRQLEKRATDAGHALPRSTLTAALARDSLPREDLVAAFVRICGQDDEQVQRWVDARRRIAAAAHPGGLDVEVAGAAPHRRWRRVLAGMVPPTIRHASWPVRILAAALVGMGAIAMPAAVVITVQDLTGPGGSDPSGDSGPHRGSSLPATSPNNPTSPDTATPAPPNQGPDWVEVRSGKDTTLTDEQAIDFDTGTVNDQNTPGNDIGLSQRADRLSASASDAAALTLLDTPGEQTPDRCAATPVNQWDNQINGVHHLTPGMNICVATNEHRAAMITIVRVPDSVVTTFTFHYTVWERH